MKCNGNVALIDRESEQRDKNKRKCLDAKRKYNAKLAPNGRRQWRQRTTTTMTLQFEERTFGFVCHASSNLRDQKVFHPNVASVHLTWFAFKAMKSSRSYITTACPTDLILSLTLPLSLSGVSTNLSTAISTVCLVTLSHQSLTQLEMYPPAEQLRKLRLVLI